MNKEVGVVDPRVDKYINELLEKAGEYDLSSQSKKILNYVVYLLLNKDFQHIMRSYRLALRMPIDGFKDDGEIKLWEIKFKEMVDKYHTGESIDPGTKFLIDEIEKFLRHPLIDKPRKDGFVVTDICINAVDTAGNFIFQFLNFRNTKNFVYWLKIIDELLHFNSPEGIVSHLYNWSKVFGTQSIHFEQENNKVKMTVFLYPDTTIKDVEQLIESKRTRISEEINKINSNVRKNESKTSDIKRDYFIYQTYMNHKTNRKRGDKIYSNITKADAVKDKSMRTKETVYIEADSIRKIVDRMNKRIKNALTNSPIELDKFLGMIVPKRHT
ncbi:hypothetical protein A2209_00440 [Candidatus Roizmanbacteria bacterium RIFOXYA1_FULL_41_12]|uniref:Uncharacterized protein n=1 Tax=Candidatus Roizmanbacteria bacterium RIFOXYA1_FULL_41_12 TaxID=1802082 RepID=A0A1F7KAY1_9BACT|nr:MAG: hypothetical protein A2209_00440 [Candidatus Roizmanbacteria bacterium RIFOXYA1_FULL_41_12]